MADTEQKDSIELQKKCQLYFDKMTFVCVFIDGGKYYHGTILEVSDLFIMFKDRYLSEPIPIFLSEITKIEPSLQKNASK